MEEPIEVPPAKVVKLRIPAGIYETIVDLAHDEGRRPSTIMTEIICTHARGLAIAVSNAKAAAALDSLQIMANDNLEIMRQELAEREAVEGVVSVTPTQEDKNGQKRRRGQ